jgi:hypothetical protein
VKKGVMNGFAAVKYGRARSLALFRSISSLYGCD